MPQRPESASLDPVTNSLWLASVRSQYGDATDWLLAGNLFDVYHSPWFRGLLGLLAFNVVLAAVQTGTAQAPLSPDVDDVAPGFACLRTPQEDPAAWSQRLHSTLLSMGYSVQCPGDNLLWVHRFTRNSLPLLCGTILLLVGLAVSERTSWWESNLALRPGQSLPIGHGTGATLRVDSVDAGRNQSASAGAVDPTLITITPPDQEPQTLRLQTSRPALHQNIWFYQTLSAPALGVQARDSSGQPLTLQTSDGDEGQFTELYLRFREEDSPRYMVVLDLSSVSPSGRSFEQKGNEKWVWVPARDVTLRLTYLFSPSSSTLDVLTLQAFRGTETSPYYQATIQAAAHIEIDGDYYSFRPERYVVIRYGQDWGWPLIFVGLAMLAAGWVLLAWRTPMRFWMLLQPDADRLTVRFIPATPANIVEPSSGHAVQVLATALELIPMEEPRDDGSAGSGRSSNDPQQP